MAARGGQTNTSASINTTYIQMADDKCMSFRGRQPKLNSRAQEVHDIVAFELIESALTLRSDDPDWIGSCENAHSPPRAIFFYKAHTSSIYANGETGKFLCISNNDNPDRMNTFEG